MMGYFNGKITLVAINQACEYETNLNVNSMLHYTNYENKVFCICSKHAHVKFERIFISL